jgi:c-di-GMP-binding flagellar brake protein YcgR
MSAQWVRPIQRRRTLRVPLAVTLVAAPGGNAYAIDISGGGMCFQVADPPKPGDALMLRFELPGWRSVSVQSRVIWVDDEGERSPRLRYREVGVCFLDLASVDRTAIERFVEDPTRFWPDSEA